MTFTEIQSILINKTVGIAGVGGLGSNCAVALARVGVGQLIIADYDKIEESNLNRQYYFYNQIGKYKVEALKENLLKINPKIKVYGFNIQLKPCNIVELFNDCDVIVEAFDTAFAKQMIIETVAEKFPNKKLVSGMGMAGYGNLDLLKTENYGNLIICGDMKTPVSGEQPPIAPKVAIVANMQADKVIEILLKKL